jgi:SAM-dependent methyltransferase
MPYNRNRIHMSIRNYSIVYCLDSYKIDSLLSERSHTNKLPMPGLWANVLTNQSLQQFIVKRSSFTYAEQESVMKSGDIKKVLSNDAQWYKKIWSMDILEMSWVEQTKSQVDFLWSILQLGGNERVLDLACGFGRHSLELASRGCKVVGVDITPQYVEEARKQAKERGLDAEFICADLRDLRYKDDFDVVLNLADGAIGYLENDTENLKIFDLISSALKPGGKHVMDVCNGGYAARHFPKRHWVFGNQSLSLADFEWDEPRSLMYYGGLEFKYGEILARPEEIHSNPTRLYNLQELSEIFRPRGMEIRKAFGDFDITVPASDDTFQIQVFSQKTNCADT